MRRTLPLLLFALLVPATGALPQNAGGPPPAAVEVANIVRGAITPTTVFVGTVTYPEVAEVAAEVEGKVTRVLIEDGERVAAGQPLALLDAELLRTRIAALEASRQQAAVEAKRARLDAARYGDLFRQRLVSEQEYDTYRYGGEALEKKAQSLAAAVAALRVELAKKEVGAPFAGVVVERRVEPGEWVDAGTAVATVARDDEVDIMVNVPGELTAQLAAGLAVAIETPRGSTRGRIAAVIPRGEVRTRTFPVKIRAANTLGLLEGMEAQVALPTAPGREGLVVPRDALISRDGRNTVILVEGGSARTVFVEVTGYLGQRVGVAGEGLAEGLPVVTRGNERLQDGQPVRILGAEE